MLTSHQVQAWVFPGRLALYDSIKVLRGNPARCDNSCSARSD